MNEKPKPAHNQPGSRQKENADSDVVNDSLGTESPADSTGLDEEKKTKEEKRASRDPREGVE